MARLTRLERVSSCFASSTQQVNSFLPMGVNASQRSVTLLVLVNASVKSAGNRCKGISKSDLAREALKRYLRVSEFRTLRTRLVARAQGGGINTEEEVFEVLRKR
jgi:hypothetical protein